VNREDFYRLRDLRTTAYGIEADPLERPVGIAIGAEAAASPAGQAGALALVNMAARVHRSLHVSAPDAPLLVPTLTGGTTLADHVFELVTAIDPYNEVRVDPTGTGLPDITVGVGSGTGAPMAITASRYTGLVTTHPIAIGSDPSTLLGACIAACLGASTLLHLALSSEPVNRSVSLWSLADAPAGPTGPAEPISPLDCGSVAVIGAGAVGSALAYWLRLLGAAGSWVFVDGDRVELHNTNRGLGLLASHAGWTSEGPTLSAAYKSDVTAPLIDADSYPGWYHDWLADYPEPPDVVIPVANGPGLRAAIGQRGEPILLHAATSQQWTSDLHRHLAEDDGCIDCRLPDESGATLACSTSPIEIASETVDAALPFLSGAAGVLLVTAMHRLTAGDIKHDSVNHWQLRLDTNTLPSIRARRWGCAETCVSRRTLPRELRRRLPRSPRWAHLD
jgi:hypothetical protein